MNPFDVEINNLIMREIGLEVGPKNKIYDQDTGCSIAIDGVEVTAPSCYTGRRTIEFDPYNNKKMMSQFFSYFTSKVEDEGGASVVAFYDIPGSSNNKRAIECKMSNDTILRSNSYSRDSLKYVDLIMQMNGDDPSVLARYDCYPDGKKSPPNKKGNTK